MSDAAQLALFDAAPDHPALALVPRPKPARPAFCCDLWTRDGRKVAVSAEAPEGPYRAARDLDAEERAVLLITFRDMAARRREGR